MLNRTGKSRVIACHSRALKELIVYILAITIRTMDGFGYKLHGRNPSMLIKLLRPQCVVAVVKHLKVLATCRKYGTRQA